MAVEILLFGFKEINQYIYVNRKKVVGKCQQNKTLKCYGIGSGDLGDEKVHLHSHGMQVDFFVKSNK